MYPKHGLYLHEYWCKLLFGTYSDILLLLPLSAHTRPCCIGYLFVSCSPCVYICLFHVPPVCIFVSGSPYLGADRLVTTTAIICLPTSTSITMATSTCWSCVCWTTWWTTSSFRDWLSRSYCLRERSECRWVGLGCCVHSDTVRIVAWKSQWVGLGVWSGQCLFRYCRGCGLGESSVGGANKRPTPPTHPHTHSPLGQYDLDRVCTSYLFQWGGA